MLMVDSVAAEEEMLNAPAQNGYEPEQEVANAMNMETLAGAISQLPERDQVVSSESMPAGYLDYRTDLQNTYI